MKKLILMSLFSLLLPLSVLAQTETRITMDEAIEIAKQEGLKRGKNEGWYSEHFQVCFDGKEWMVFFMGKSGIIGSHYLVTISANGKKISYSAGI